VGRQLVVVGDAVLDRDLEGRVDRLAPDAPVPVVDDLTGCDRPGGAGLAAALLAHDGRDVVLITALAGDAAGRTLAGLLAEAGVSVIALPLRGRTPEKVRIRTDGRSLLRLDHGPRNGSPIGGLPDRAAGALRSAAGLLVSDYGRGLTAHPDVRAAIGGLPARLPKVWDPHPRGATPVPRFRLVTPNAGEARGFVPEVDGEGLSAVAARAALLRERWEAAAVTVTLGSAGALLSSGSSPPLVVPAAAAAGGDPCGAGDRFASAAAALLADGALPSEAVTEAVRRASAYVAAGGAASLNRYARREEPRHRAARDVVAEVRARGGTVVATSGCFDILHAGHVSTLRASRSLGDCLVVCLNSDRSVRELKGPGRPLVPATERTQILSALECVDAVAVFDERTPERLLAELRPDVFTKGGDYAIDSLPEAHLVASWGGQAVILPFVEGRSTTALVREVERLVGSA
jgi:rfaE bifunctional protein nucleotidyltransferase chain/domain